MYKESPQNSTDIVAHSFDVTKVSDITDMLMKTGEWSKILACTNPKKITVISMI